MERIGVEKPKVLGELACGSAPARRPWCGVTQRGVLDWTLQELKCSARLWCNHRLARARRQKWSGDAVPVRGGHPGELARRFSTGEGPTRFPCSHLFGCGVQGPEAAFGG